MSSTNNPGRVAGFLYLLLLAAPLRLIYIPSKLFVHGNATATANNIAAHETLFRFGITGDLFTGTMVIFVALALYRLFKGVDQNQSEEHTSELQSPCNLVCRLLLEKKKQ